MQLSFKGIGFRLCVKGEMEFMDEQVKGEMADMEDCEPYNAIQLLISKVHHGFAAEEYGELAAMLSDPQQAARLSAPALRGDNRSGVASHAAQGAGPYIGAGPYTRSLAPNSQRFLSMSQSYVPHRPTHRLLKSS